MLTPKPLFPGARVALVAPSGSVPPERLEPAVKSVENLGLEPVVFESCRSKHGYFAGGDRLRADDINRAFADQTIDGVICIRGGYGTQRLMSLIDFGMIRRNPKYFSGYSDITALHIKINQSCGFVTYHTPMPATELYNGADEFSVEQVKKTLFGGKFGELKNPNGVSLRTLVSGCARGILIGGNLSLVVSSLGTPYEIDTKGKVFFLEDVDEEPYSVDRMLVQLKASGKFRDCAGIILGYYTNCGAKQPENSLTLEQVFDELIVPEKRPAVMNFACGHSLPTLSLPLGKEVKLDSNCGKITVID